MYTKVNSLGTKVAVLATQELNKPLATILVRFFTSLKYSRTLKLGQNLLEIMSYAFGLN